MGLGLAVCLVTPADQQAPAHLARAASETPALAT